MRRMIPSLNWLRVFEAAARAESFSRAADLLNMSTSAISQQVKALESHLDCELFERGPRQVTLTDAGHAFLPAVRQSLSTIEETANSLFGEERDNTLTLQAVLIFGTAWLAPRLPEFALAHPSVQLHLSGIYHDYDYRRAGAELQILFGPVHRSWGQCDRLFDETIFPVAIPQIAAAIETPADLLQQRLIQVSTHQVNWNSIAQELDIGSIPTQRFCFADNSETALFLAASGYGIALARAPTTDAMLARLGLEPCLDFAGFHSNEAYYLVYQNLENLSAAAHRFRDWLLQGVRTS